MQVGLDSRYRKEESCSFINGFNKRETHESTPGLSWQGPPSLTLGAWSGGSPFFRVVVAAQRFRRLPPCPSPLDGGGGRSLGGIQCLFCCHFFPCDTAVCLFLKHWITYSSFWSSYLERRELDDWWNWSWGSRGTRRGTQAKPDWCINKVSSNKGKIAYTNWLLLWFHTDCTWKNSVFPQDVLTPTPSRLTRCYVIRLITLTLIPPTMTMEASLSQATHSGQGKDGNLTLSVAMLGWRQKFGARKIQEKNVPVL